MRFMVLMKADQHTEAGELPDEKLLAAMGNFNEELVKAGIMQAGDGLQASSKGARINFSGGQVTVTDGPFTEAKELIAGYWIWEVKSKQEAIEWAKRIPPPPYGEANVEIRQIFTADDFGAEYTPELRAQADSQGARITAAKK